MASLTVPVIVKLGADYGLTVPLIGAHLFCFFFGLLADDTPPVCVAAYAASAIAKSNPIRTGTQGFTYDMRTAILPFIFIFNTDLLLIGIHSWLNFVIVFLTALIAMFSFASLTQNFIMVKNRFYESILLGLITIVLFRPQAIAHLLNFGNKYVWYIIGAALFGFTLLLQLQRLRTKNKSFNYHAAI